jgi:hypothetical protein
MRTGRSRKQCFEYWWEDFLTLCDDEEIDIDQDNQGIYRKFYDDGMTPQQLIDKAEEFDLF